VNWPLVLGLHTGWGVLAGLLAWVVQHVRGDPR
jgi:hypothetical protein